MSFDKGVEAMRKRAIEVVNSWQRDPNRDPHQQSVFTYTEVNQLLNDICGDLQIATVKP